MSYRRIEKKTQELNTMKVILVPTPRHVEDTDVFLSVGLARKTTRDNMERYTFFASLARFRAGCSTTDRTGNPTSVSHFLIKKKKRDDKRESGVGADCFELSHL